MYKTHERSKKHIQKMKKLDCIKKFNIIFIFLYTRIYMIYESNIINVGVYANVIYFTLVKYYEYDKMKKSMHHYFFFFYIRSY